MYVSPSFPLRCIFGFYFHNFYLASQRIISKENRVSENTRFQGIDALSVRSSAFSIYLVSNASRFVGFRVAVEALLK